MTNREILIKALDKAMCNRYHFPYHDILDGCSWGCRGEKIHVDSFIENNILCNGAPIEEMHQQVAIRDILFSHDFAKAFFGESKIFEKEITYSGATDETKAWEFYLQQMVLEKEPLKYIEEFLND